ncbi:MAG: cytochrome c biogenesis protein CcsA [Gammaproteobacteria bacterium]|nr:cytochrome c biogenesis protein CcsA [Gammaproteobacteria bacterium]
MVIALIASVSYWLSVFFLYRRDKFPIQWLVLFMGAALGAHCWQMVDNFHGVLRDLSIMNVLTLVTFCMTVLGAIRYFFQSDKVAYTVVAMITAVCVWLPAIFKVPSTIVDRWSLKVHVTLSIAAYIALGFSALYACFLLVQDGRLRKGKSVFNLALPLNYIERTMMSFAMFGELLLTLSLATGTLFIYDLWGQHVAHKMILGAISWFIIGIILVRHYRHGFRGKHAAWWVICGFCCLLLSYFGSAFVLQIILPLSST